MPALAARVALVCLLFPVTLSGVIWLTPPSVETVASVRAWRWLSGVWLNVVMLAAIAMLLRQAGGSGWAGIGLTFGRDAMRGFATGFLAWLLPAALAVTVAGALGVVELRTTVPWTTLAGIIAAHLLTVFLLEAFPEELAFRGYIASQLQQRYHMAIAIVLQALLFTAVAVWLHGGAVGIDTSLFLTMGLVFGYFRWLTGSIWTGLGFHLAFQTGMQMLIGGQRGPALIEPSGMLAMVVLGMIPFAIAVPLIDHLARRHLARSARG